MVPLAYNLRSLTVRKASSIATAGGIALVVFVLASALMLANGIRRTLGRSGRDDVAIVLRKGADAELASGIEEPQVPLILAAREVARDAGGRPLGVGEVVAVIAQDKKGTDGGVSNVQVRGVPDTVWEFRPTVEVVAGRRSRPGTDEVVIGKAIRGRFQGMELGQSFELRKNRPVTVVGVIADHGSSFESEVWADLRTVQAAFGRDAIVSAVRVKLESAAKLDAFAANVEQNRRLGLEVMRETEYYEKSSEGTSLFILGMGIVIAVFFSVGAMIGAMITMYGQVSYRRREIGTLRALGFSRTAVLTAFLTESTVLALAGGAVGALAALAMGFVRFSTMNFQSWSEISFTFDPTPQILVTALLAAGAMGLAGGLLPAIRAARMSVLDALRE